MRIILCGGGTAGHVNPAIAVAEEIRDRDKNAEILFIGRDGGDENSLILREGFDLKTIRIKGLRRSLSIDNIKRLSIAARARTAAKEIIKVFKPDVILGTGGYVCWPVISAGKSLKIKTAIHESNIIPGLTTKLLAGICDRVFLNREETKKYLRIKKNVLTVGNPLRKSFRVESYAGARKKLGIRDGEYFILSFGGSIGAEKLNQVLIEVMEKYSTVTSGVRHLHGAGKRYFGELEEIHKHLPKNKCRIVPYIDNMPSLLSAADLVICRSGAMTVSEIERVGADAILVPSPNVSGNHQYLNARYLSDRGAATLIEEKNLTAEQVIFTIKSLKIDKNGRKKRAKTLRALSEPNSAKLIADELFLLKKR